MTANLVDLEQIRRSCSSCSLRELCLPATLDAEALRQVDEIVRQRQPLARGEHLYHVGDPMTALFLVRSGSMKTVVEDASGEVQVVGFHLPGEVVGLDGIGNDKHQCHAEALESTSLCRVSMDRLTHVLEQVPALHRQVLRLASREIVQEQRHLAMIGKRQAQSRLAAFLTDLRRRQIRLGQCDEVLTLGMSRYDIANYLGLVVETVSRLFGRFQEQAVLEVDRRRIRILDLAALERLCQSDAEDLPSQRRA